MRTGRAWWAFVLMLLLCTFPALFAFVNVVLVIDFSGDFSKIVKPVLGSSALLFTSMLPFSIMLPSLLTDITDECVRQRKMFSVVEIKWDDLRKVSLNDHKQLTLFSETSSLTFSLYLSNSPDQELKSFLSLPQIEVAKERMNQIDRAELQNLQEEVTGH